MFLADDGGKCQVYGERDAKGQEPDLEFETALQERLRILEVARQDFCLPTRRIFGLGLFAIRLFALGHFVLCIVTFICVAGHQVLGERPA